MTKLTHGRRKTSVMEEVYNPKEKSISVSSIEPLLSSPYVTHVLDDSNAPKVAVASNDASNLAGCETSSQRLEPESKASTVATDVTCQIEEPIASIDELPDDEEDGDDNVISHACEIDKLLPPSSDGADRDALQGPVVVQPHNYPPAPSLEVHEGGDPAVQTSTRNLLINAYDRLEKVRQLTGSIEDSTWSARSRAILPEALKMVDIINAADEEARNQLCLRIKNKTGRRRGPNKENIELLAVQCCLPPEYKEKQKEWSRFAKVVKVAVHERVTSEGAADFLRDHSLTRCLEKARELARGTKARELAGGEEKPKKSKFLKMHDQLASNLKDKPGPLFERARDEFATFGKTLKELAKADEPPLPAGADDEQAK